MRDNKRKELCVCGLCHCLGDWGQLVNSLWGGVLQPGLLALIASQTLPAQTNLWTQSSGSWNQLNRDPAEAKTEQPEAEDLFEMSYI